MKKILPFIFILFMVLPTMGTEPPAEEIHHIEDGIFYAFYFNPTSPAKVIPNESWGNVYGGQINGNIPTYSIRFGYDTNVTMWYRYYAAPTYKALVIPDSIEFNGYQRPVSSIFRMSHFVKKYGDDREPDAYINDNTYLETVQLNNIISSIPNKCFYRCVNLKHVFFPKKPDKNYNINEMAFGGCPKLSIRLPRFCYTKVIDYNQGLPNHARIMNLGDSIQKLEVVWDVPPHCKNSKGYVTPLFQFVDTLVVPKGCLQNYKEWLGTNYRVILEGNYEAEGNYPWEEIIPENNMLFVDNGVHYSLQKGTDRAYIIPDKYEELRPEDDNYTSWLYNSASTYKNLDIPETIIVNGKVIRPVFLTRLGHFVNYGKNVYSSDNIYLETVQINSPITFIRDSCFYRCVNLRELSFQEKNKTVFCNIFDMAFGHCPKLSIRLPRFIGNRSISITQPGTTDIRYYNYICNLGDSIRKLEVVWNEPPLANVSDSDLMLIQKLYELRQTGQIKPLFQYVDTLVVPKGCLQNYVDWQDIKYGIIMEGDYEAEGKYLYDNAEYNEYLQETSIENTSCDSRQNMHDNHIYDLQGRRLNGIPSRGLYIRNGRKFVSK